MLSKSQAMSKARAGVLHALNYKSTCRGDVFDAPPGYLGLYTHSFSLANLRLPLTEFFCEVLEYFQVHISRLNPFGCAKLTTFVVMCKAYGCEPSVDLFRGFFNLCRAGKWLTFAKRSEKHVPNLLLKVITHIEGWHERFFYVQDSIIPANVLVDIPECYVFPDPFFSWLASTFVGNMKWLSGNLSTPKMMRIYCFCPRNLRRLRHWFPICFSKHEASKSRRRAYDPACEVTADSRESPKPELFVVHPRSVDARIKDKKCKTRGGSSRPPVKRKLAPGSSTSRATHANTSSSKDDVPYLTVSDDDEVRLSFFNLLYIVFALWVHQYICILSFLGLPDVLELIDTTVCHLKTSAITPPAWKNHLDNHMDMELLDLHDRCYARQFVVDKAVNRRSRDLLQVIEKLRGEFDVIKDKEKAREEECEELRAKYEAAMTEFEKNPTVVALREKIYTLSTKVKEHKVSLDRMMLESQKWAGYQQSLSTLESNVTSLEAEKARLEAVKVSLQKEVEELKQDRREVVSKVSPYAAMELIYSDDMGAFRLVTATFPWLDEFMADPSAPIKALL
ncbi:hypothetical protein Tco_1251179, partial [Tanacetum coccineum]